MLLSCGTFYEPRVLTSSLHVVIITLDDSEGTIPFEQALNDNNIRQIDNFNRLCEEALEASKVSRMPTISLTPLDIFSQFMVAGMPGKAFHFSTPATSIVTLTNANLAIAHLRFGRLVGLRRGRSGLAGKCAAELMYTMCVSRIRSVYER